MGMLIAVDDAEGADVMPSRPNEHSSLGAPVRGCYHRLKKATGTPAPLADGSLNRAEICPPYPPWLEHTQREPRQKHACEGACIPGSPSQERLTKCSCPAIEVPQCR